MTVTNYTTDEPAALMQHGRTVTVDEFLHQRRPAWMNQAACRGLTDTMFPSRGGPVDPPKQVCADCPVRVDCLEYAVNLPVNPDGIWGGTSRRQRQRIRAQQRRQTREAA